jgi:hypothetical protein
MWQIHVTYEGAVTVDGGDVYRNKARYALDAADLGKVDGDCLVVWSGSGSGAVSVVEPGDTLRKPFRILGKIKKNEGSFAAIQYIAAPLEIYSGDSGDGGGGGGGEEGGGDDEETPGGGQNPDPNNPPPCGHPLNAEPGGGPFDDFEDDDRHPLDYEGDGGYTPICFGDQQ